MFSNHPNIKFIQTAIEQQKMLIEVYNDLLKLDQLILAHQFNKSEENQLKSDASSCTKGNEEGGVG